MFRNLFFGLGAVAVFAFAVGFRVINTPEGVFFLTPTENCVYQELSDFFGGSEIDQSNPMLGYVKAKTAKAAKMVVAQNGADPILGARSPSRCF